MNVEEKNLNYFCKTPVQIINFFPYILRAVFKFFKIFLKTLLQNTTNYPYIVWGYFSFTSNLYVKVRVKGVDVNEIVDKKIN